MPRFIRSACLTNFLPVARSFGLDPYRLLKEAGLDRSCLVDPEIKIPVGEMFSTPTGLLMVYSTRAFLSRRRSQLEHCGCANGNAGSYLAFAIDQHRRRCA